MAEKTTTKSKPRNRLVKRFSALGKMGGNLLGQLTLLQIFSVTGIALFITFLVLGYQFQDIPDHQVGDIADRTIEAPYDFAVLDEEATHQKKQEILRTVPAVFTVDLRVNSRLESDLRAAFSQGRQLIAEQKKELGLSTSSALSKSAHQKLLTLLGETLSPQFNKDEIVAILLEQSFSSQLENEMVKLLQESMKYPPGVILSRDWLLRYQGRGIVLRDITLSGISGQDKALNDWMSVRDLSQAKDVLRQNQYELTVVGGEEKKRLISFLDSWLRPNMDFSETATRAREQLAINEVDPVFIQVKRGKIIVRAGDEINSRQASQLEALKSLKQPRRVAGKFVGIFLIMSFFSFFLWQYFLVQEKRERRTRSHYYLLVVVLILSLVITKIFIFLGDLIAGSVRIDQFQDPLHFYFVAPLALGAILVILLGDLDLAVLQSLFFAVVVGLLTGQLSLLVYALTGSIAAIRVLDNYGDRFAIIRGGLIIGSINVLTILALQFYSSPMGFQWMVFGVRAAAGLLSGVFAAMLASLLLPVLESWFDITTDIRLLELSNLNKPILRRLALEAPGTYHHSIIVGTLAEAAAEAIGANAFLVRVGAYYHDIGKLKKPEYYVENQIYSSNKHESLSPSISSLILASHVKDGLAMAEQIKLVPMVRELIPQHHGTRLMTYFYQKAKDAATNKQQGINEDDFRYPGPKPQTKEAAILMLADQVEAAARTLQDPSPGRIRSLIKRLVQSTIQDGQFDECDITMKDLDMISQAFERVITGMHHHRIEYPGFEFNRQIEAGHSENQRIQ